MGSQRSHAAALGKTTLSKTILVRKDDLVRYYAKLRATLDTDSSTHRQVGQVQEDVVVELVVPRAEAAAFERAVYGQVRTAEFRALDLSPQAPPEAAATGADPVGRTATPPQQKPLTGPPELRGRQGERFDKLTALPGSHHVAKQIIAHLRRRAPVRSRQGRRALAYRQTW
jgi:hypothetical protein